MTENNNIENLFRSEFQNFEAPVDPAVWASVQSAVNPAATAAVTVKGVSVTAKIISAVAFVVTITTAVFYFLSDKKEKQQDVAATIQNTVIPNAEIKEVQAEKINDNLNAATKSQKKVLQPGISTPSSVPANIAKSASEVAVTPNNIPPAITEIPSNQTAVKEHKSEAPVSDPAPSEAKTENKTEDAIVTPPVERKVIKKEFPLKKNTTFTPNGDGVGDELILETEGLDLKTIQVEIYNQNLRLIKSWSNINGSWNGKLMNGTDAPAGTYNIAIFATSFDGTVYRTTTTINLLR